MERVGDSKVKLLRTGLILAALAVFWCWPVDAPAKDAPKLANGYELVVEPATVYGWTFSGTQVLGGPSRNPPKGYEPNGSFGRIDWRAWTRRRAYGRGTVWTNDCDPSCGSGTWTGEATRVSVYRVRFGHFTRMRFACICRGPSRLRAILAYRSQENPQWKILRQWQATS